MFIDLIKPCVFDSAVWLCFLSSGAKMNKFVITNYCAIYVRTSGIQEIHMVILFVDCVRHFLGWSIRFALGHCEIHRSKLT